MKATGNGTPQVCVQNLLKTIRGEVPYERIKGLDRKLIDQPSEIAGPDLKADVEFVLENYEPRVALDSVDLEALTASLGSYQVSVNIDNINN